MAISYSGEFFRAHTLCADALEQSFPRLQEMLGQQGFQLQMLKSLINPPHKTDSLVELVAV